MWFALPKFGEWFDLVSSPAGVGEITESNLLILPVNSNGAHRLFHPAFLLVDVFVELSISGFFGIVPAAQIKTPARAMQALCVWFRTGCARMIISPSEKRLLLHLNGKVVFLCFHWF